MKPRRQTAPLRAAAPRPEVFMVREHALSITAIAEGRWTVSVDGGPILGTFGSQVEAWEAGVRGADLRDLQRPQLSPVRQGSAPGRI
jgi:hypothetical protein